MVVKVAVKIISIQQYNGLGIVNSLRYGMEVSCISPPYPGWIVRASLLCCRIYVRTLLEIYQISFDLVLKDTYHSLPLCRRCQNIF